MQRRRIYCGVPQGSVLGPLLCNIAFDRVLRTRRDAGSYIICYADDTLLLVEDIDVDMVIEAAHDLLGRVLDNIRQTGLRISPAKTEAVLFGCRSRRKPVLQLEDFDITSGMI